MADRVLHEGVVHWAYRMKLCADWKQGNSTQECCVRFFCTGLIHAENSVVFVRDSVNCMTCLVIRVRIGSVHVRFR